MTTLTYSTSDVQTRKVWADRVHLDITTDTEIISDAVGDGILVTKDDLTKGAGDQVKFHFINRNSGAGFIDDETATGSEDDLDYYQDTVNIHHFRQVISIPNSGTISAQRVTFDLPEDTYMTLRNWIQEKMIVGFFNQTAGNDASSITYDGVTYTGASTLLKITGGNTVTDASTNQIIRAGSGNTTDTLVAADSTATFNLDLILQAENAAKKNRPYVAKLGEGNNVNYACYIHTDGWLQLMQDTSSPFTMRDIYYSNLQARKENESAVAGVFSETKIIVSDKLPYGVTSDTADTNARRAVFCGKEAAALAYGQGMTADGKTTPGFSFKEDMQDVEHIRRISINGMYGITKAVFNSVDRGTIAITHYVA